MWCGCGLLLVERLWTLLVGWLWALLVEGCGLCLWNDVGFACKDGCWLCLFLSLFLRDLVMLESEYRLLEKRKQPARLEKVACSDRESNFPE